MKAVTLTVTPTAATTSSVQAAQGYSTPQLLRHALFAVFCLGMVCLACIMTGLRDSASAWKTIEKDAVPSIRSAQEIKASLADLDALAAIELLSANSGSDAAGAYEKRREAVNDLLIMAARNIKPEHQDSELEPLKRLFNSLGAFESKIQQARDYRDAQDRRLFTSYVQASILMDSRMLPAAEELELANQNSLDAAYTHRHRSDVGWMAAIWLPGIGLIAALIFIQIVLAVRTRRMLNPLLIVATAITVWLLVTTTASLYRAENEMRTANESSFASISRLRNAKAATYRANAATSRMLIDPAQAKAHMESFKRQTESLVWVPSMSYTSAVELLTHNQSPFGLTGLLATELEKARDRQERESIIILIATLGQYREIANHMLELEQRGAHAEAIALSTGNSSGQSTWALNQLTEGLDRLISSRENEFERGLGLARSATNGVDVVAPAALIVVALLTVFGLLPRLREYA